MRSTLSLCAPAVALLCLLVAPVASPEEAPASETATPPPAVDQFRERAASESTFAALDYLEGLGEPRTVGEAYLAVTQALIEADKDLALAVWVSRAGIRYCLKEARAHEADAPRDAAALRETARVLAYNLASSTWPAWETEGITPTPDDLRAGFDAAKLNLRLTQELGLGPRAEAAAHWMLGAHHLARRELDGATGEFGACEGKATEANEPVAASMAKGYLAIVQILSGEADAGRAACDAVLSELASTDSEEARFYHDQLERALAFFSK